MAADSSGAAASRLPLKLLVVAALAGVAIRLLFGLGYWTGKPLTRDEHEYLSLARSLAAGHGFVYDAALRDGSFTPFGRAPGYPAFLALAGGGAPETSEVPASVKVAQSVVGGIGVLLVGLIAHRIGGRRMAAAAAFIAAAYPPLVWVSGYALSEALFWPIGLSLVWLCDRAQEPGTHVGRSIVAGLVLGGAILVRPGLLVFVPMLALWLIAKRRIAVAAILLAATCSVLGPWILRNYAHHGKLIIVASDGGVTFWTGNHPLAIGEGDMAANPGIKLDNLTLRARHPGLNEEQMEPIYYREALSWIRANPGAWVALEFRKLFYLIVPIGPSYTLHSALYYVSSLLSYASVLALGVAGLVRLGARRWRSPTLWLMAAAAIAVCLVFFPQERFRIPTIDPTLVVFSGAALVARRDVS